MHVASNTQRTITSNMQRGNVQALHPETLNTPSKIAQKACLLDMLDRHNDICVSKACAAVPAAASPRHRIHTPHRTACKIQPLG